MYSSTARRHIFGQVVRTVTTASLRASRQATTLASTVRSLFGARDLESPAFHVVDQLEHYEVRYYWQELVKAEITSADFQGRDEFNRRGFSVLGKYIGVFGTNPDNEAKTPIATAPVVTQGKGTPVAIPMTAPVVAQPDASAGGKHETIAFILPAEFSLENAPTPLDPRVKLLPVPSSTCAVHQFTWGCNMATAEKKKEELLQWIARDGTWEVDGKWTLNRYNPPFTVPFLRTNEIQIPVKPKESESGGAGGG